jgi:hypothetical protein
MNKQSSTTRAIIVALGLGGFVLGGPACAGEEPGSTGGAGTGGVPGTGGAGGASACPTGLPTPSGSCSPNGLSCYYGGCSGSASYCGAMASCSNGSWSIGYTNCMCPPTGGASSAGGSGTGGSAGGCNRYSTDDAHCSTMGYPPHAYFCRVPATRPDPTCVMYNGIDSGDFYCCP